MKVKVLAAISTILIFCLLVCNSAIGQLKATTTEQIQQLISEKNSRTPVERKISSQLLQAIREATGRQMAKGVQLQRADVAIDSLGGLQVDINATVTDELQAKIKALGGTVIYASGRFHSLRARITLAMVLTIAAYPEVNFIKPAAQAHIVGAGGPGAPPLKLGAISDVNNSNVNAGRAKQPDFTQRVARIKKQLGNYIMTLGAGTATTEGDHTMGADSVRKTYGYEGQGTRIGVLSDSYNRSGAAPDAGENVASGDLPGKQNPLGNTTPVTVVQDYSGPYITDEGRAMLQLVHDIAPKAQLYFATAFQSEASFADNILTLREAPYNCDIIIDDVIYYDEPAYQDGIVAQAVNTVTASGAMYFSSAGNGGSALMRYASIWEGDFNDAGSPIFTPGNGKTGTIHNFGTIEAPATGDTIFATLSAVYTLKWADPLGRSNNDYDFFIIDGAGKVLYSSTDIQDGTQDPYEEIDVTKYIPPWGYQAVVFKDGKAKPVTFVINANTNGYGPAFRHTTPGLTYGHSAATDAFSVAATPASAAYPGLFTAADHVEYFSSDGPRHIFFNADTTPVTPGNFTIATNGGVIRKKPDITAADGVATTIYQFNPFYGTSAAAPQAGAVAALLLSANKEFTPGQIRNILTTTALDIEAPGYDNNSGYGIVQAFKAMQVVKPKALPAISFGQVTVTEGAFSNHNGSVEPGEACNLTVQLLNQSLANAADVYAVISTTTPGITITQDSAFYGNIPKGGNSINTAAPFSIAISSTVDCNSPVTFYIIASHNSANTQSLVYKFIVGKIFSSNIASKMGAIPPKGNAYKVVSGAQKGILMPNFNSSNCYYRIPNPGLQDSTSLHQFDAYTFTNTETTDQCVFVTVTNTSGTFYNMYTAAYDSAGFVPSNPAANFVGGPSTGSFVPMQYSFTAPAKKKFTVVVYDQGILPASGSSYTLNVTYTNCLAVPPCANLVVNTSLPAGATGVAYKHVLTATGGSGLYKFSFKGILPPGMRFNGSTLVGKPTQAGNFPITVTFTDPLSCNHSASQDLVLTINGTLPNAVNVFSGSQQQAPVRGVFAKPLRAKVLDAANKPLGGVNVIFKGPANPLNAGGAFEGGRDTIIVVTDSAGIATAPLFIADSLAGSYSVSAFVNGLAMPASFTLTNTCLLTVVTNNADNGPGSLRYIVDNACPGAIISFAAGINKISLTSGQINIYKPLSIAGPGADKLSISGGRKFRIFRILARKGDSVNISGITLSDGLPKGGDSPNSLGGGAIVNLDATLVINGCVLVNNDASFSPGGSGGGIYNNGTLTINNTTIAKNKSLGGGGGIISYAGKVSISNSTIASNLTTGSYAWGGGIFFAYGPSLNLTNCTLFGNTATIGGNIFVSMAYSPSTDTLKNTIVAGGIIPAGSDGNSPDLHGPYFITAGYNLIQDVTPGAYTITGSPSPTDIMGVSPKLLPMGNYGGPTPTMLPLPNSPVINKGQPALIASQYDQRGYTRVIAGRADIGAVEANYAVEALSGTPQSTAVNTPFKTTLQALVMEDSVPVNGVPVIFSGPAGSVAGGVFTNGQTAYTAVTNADGIATTSVITANGTIGDYTVSGTIGPVFNTADFNLSNTKALAVSFGRITAAINNCAVQIKWQTLTAEAGESFTVEQSTDGINYHPLYTVNATGNSASVQNYTYTHATPAEGANYYRVKQKDANGPVSYSATIIAVNTCSNSPVIAYPNPVHSTLTLVMPGSVKQTISIFDAQGRLVKRYAPVSGTLNVDVSHWAGGVYSLSLVREDKTTFSLKIVKD